MSKFYRFLLILTVLIFLVGIGCTGNENSNPKYSKDKRKSNELKKIINSPSLGHYYVLGSKENRYYGAKVDQVLKDSLVLRCVKNAKSSVGKNLRDIMLPFILDEAEFFNTTFAKSDLIASLENPDNEPFPGITITNLANNDTLQIVKIYRQSTDPDKVMIGLNKGHPLRVKLENKIKSFVSQNSMDSSINLLDTASKNYLLKIVNLSREGDLPKLKKLITESKTESATYNLVLFTYYSYCKTVKGKFPKTDKDLLVDFGFYLKLLNVGLWSIEDQVNQISFRGVDILSKDKAKVSMSKISNILERRDFIRFDLLLNKEEGEWKINLPSSFYYTKHQIIKTGPNFPTGHKNYRKMVRDQLIEVNPAISIDSIFIY